MKSKPGLPNFKAQVYSTMLPCDEGVQSSPDDFENNGRVGLSPSLNSLFCLFLEKLPLT